MSTTKGNESFITVQSEKLQTQVILVGNPFNCGINTIFMNTLGQDQLQLIFKIFKDSSNYKHDTKIHTHRQAYLRDIAVLLQSTATKQVLP